MTFLAMTRHEFDAVLHGVVPLAMRGFATLVVLASAYLVWRQWYYSYRPGEKAPRILWGALSALLLILFGIWRWI